MGTIVQANVSNISFGNFNADVFEEGHEIQLVQRHFVVLHITITFGGAIVIIEGHAGRDDVNHGESLVTNSSFENGLELFLVAAEGSRDEGRSPLQGKRATIERGKFIGRAALRGGADVGGRRKLSLRQTVDA